MMTDRSKTLFAGTVYDTPREAAVASAVEFLTAGGLNSIDQALGFWEDGAEANAEEAGRDWDHSDRWEDVWDEVRDDLESRQ
jgi:hypothetical protein